MFNYIVENYYKDTAGWMRGTRLEKLMLRDRWLDGTFYDKIDRAFNQEQDGNQYVPIYNRRPAEQFNFPKFIAGLTARKLFAGRHVPRLKHEDKQFLLKVQALVEELQMPPVMLEAIKRGSVGSVLILFKFLAIPVRALEESEAPDTEIEQQVKGVVEVKNTQYVTPTFNQFKELTSVLEHYLVMGSELKQRGLVRSLTLDTQGNAKYEDVDPSLKYWYIKVIDTKQECIYYPIKEHDWNPINFGQFAPYLNAGLIPYAMEDGSNPLVHNLGFMQGVWIKNLNGGIHPEGESTWASGLNNFIELDYAKSQNGRGLRYSAAPQLVIKGDLREEVESGDMQGFRQPRDPASTIRLAADEKGADGMGGTTGHNAFLLETTGAASAASDSFVSSLKHTTFESLSSARKDLESIAGTMSGKAIELIDEDFVDLVQELRLMYITYGYLPLMKKICKAAMIAGHQLMQSITEQIIDGLTVECPPLYLPDAQEIQFLVSAMVQATQTQQPGPKGVDGTTSMIQIEPLIDPIQAQQMLAKQLDLSEESDDKPTISDTDVISEEQLQQTPGIQPSEPQPDPEEGPTNNLSPLEQLITPGLARRPIT